MPLIEQCICGNKIFRHAYGYGLELNECRSCFALHQDVEMTPTGLEEWYRRYPEVYTHTYEQDMEAAKKRIDAYGDYLKSPILDIGCGNGAFRDACREIGLVASGYDIGGETDHQTIDGIGPYSTITLHDVLEHAVNPVGMLKNCRRMLQGTLIIDFPDFFSPDGEHHWKPIEHLWFLSERQLERLVSDAGFRIKDRYHPIPGKIVFIAQ